MTQHPEDTPVNRFLAFWWGLWIMLAFGLLVMISVWIGPCSRGKVTSFKDEQDAGRAEKLAAVREAQAEAFEGAPVSLEEAMKTTLEELKASQGKATGIPVPGTQAAVDAANAASAAAEQQAPAQPDPEAKPKPEPKPEAKPAPAPKSTPVPVPVPVPKAGEKKPGGPTPAKAASEQGQPAKPKADPVSKTKPKAKAKQKQKAKPEGATEAEAGKGQAAAAPKSKSNSNLKPKTDPAQDKPDNE